ncbi:hypothetical protein [Agromyces cerinus]|uniref:Uncharacterized protein n=1 Tax=Agromyces cerinus subsp. cerinus TaxID=232089 RepID=A0A1N6EQL0_9MICO|nr:hypothetical protein [Agromyces cerinus]SIN85379.1 hypothetical protein SAMN05443544_1375 [Agromyces cerinus subsp. cerinus]
MDDRLLDEQLGASRPVAAERTPVVVGAMGAMSAEARASRKHRRRWFGTVGVVGVLMLAGAGTSAAMALPAVRQFLGWEVDRTITYTSEVGGECTVLLGLDYHQWRNGLIKTEDEMYAAAMGAADSLDLSQAGIDEIVGDARAELEVDDPFSFLVLSPVDFETYAVEAALRRALDDAFAAAGIVQVEMQLRSTCERGDA